MKLADFALYRCKDLGRDQAAGFKPEPRLVAETRAAQLEEIETGLLCGELEFYYQPIASNFASLEALMRWRHPRLDLFAQRAFSTAFENVSLKAALGMLIVEQVFADSRRLPVDQLKIDKNIATNFAASIQFMPRVAPAARKIQMPGLTEDRLPLATERHDEAMDQMQFIPDYMGADRSVASRQINQQPKSPEGNS